MIVSSSSNSVRRMKDLCLLSRSAKLSIDFTEDGVLGGVNADRSTDGSDSGMSICDIGAPLTVASSFTKRGRFCDLCLFRVLRPEFGGVIGGLPMVVLRLGEF